MTYCTLDDINNGGFFKFDLSQTTTLINKQPAPNVINNDILPTVDSVINDALRMFFVVPVDPILSPNATTTLKRIAKLYAASMIATRLYLQQGTSDSPQAAAWKADADAQIQNCLTVGNYLADAVKSSDSPDVKSDLISDNISGIDGGCYVKPFFHGMHRRNRF